MAKYVCKNFGACSKADAKEEVEIAAGMESVCEECGLTLTEVETAAPAGRRIKPVILGIGLLVLVAIGAGGWMVMGNSGDRSMAQAGSKENDAPAQTQGVAPDEVALEKAKQGVDELIKAGTSDAASAAQNTVIAQEHIKAAIPHMQAGRWVDADEQLAKAKAANPEEPLVYVNLAISHLKQEQPKEALKSLETAFEKGFRDFSTLEADADLKKLTGADPYKALVVRYQPK